MLKKLTSFLKFVCTSALWSLCLGLCLRALMKFCWAFDPFSINRWKLIKSYWNNNGVIEGASDYLLFVALLIAFIIWLYGLRYFYKLSYVRLLLAPFRYFNERTLKKYEERGAHVVIKNIAIGEKMTVEDVIQKRIKQMSKDTPSDDVHTSADLRSSIAHKITERKDQ